MTHYLFAVDHLSTWVGKIFAWLIVVLTGVVCFDVITRKLFNARNQWASDMEYILYGIFFMMAGAYALSRGSMVRGDMFYRGWSVRTQATVDLTLYLLFFLPGVLALVWSGWSFAEFARSMNERSTTTPNGPLIWPFKYFIPISAGFLLAQGLVEIIRCIQAMRTGAWPQRLSDVEETETRLAREEQL